MLYWIKAFMQAHWQTKLFVVTTILFLFITIATAIYCYARLDYVRSYKTNKTASSEKTYTSS